MSVIKQISIFNGSNWDTPADIGANAENIDFTYTTGSQQGNTAALSSILPAQALTASRVLVTDSNGKLSSSSISSGILNTALSGASTVNSLQSQINTLNTNLKDILTFSFKGGVKFKNASIATQVGFNNPFCIILLSHKNITIISADTVQSVFSNLINLGTPNATSIPTLADGTVTLGTDVNRHYIGIAPRNFKYTLV